MYYLTLNDMEIILRRMNKRYSMNETIVNSGQLDFALKKPAIKLGGVEQYPKLYQKAAILMESITKLHPFSDGNKRCAMMAAEYMLYRNNASLVLPLKSIRFSVDIAMDEKDEMRDEIQKWFKTHAATNAIQLSIMILEHMEEESIIRNLLEAKKYDTLENLVSTWMAFDTYPEHKKKWDELVEQWKKVEPRLDDRKEKSVSSKGKWDALRELGKHLTPQHHDHSTMMNVKKIDDLTFKGHTMKQLEFHDELLSNLENFLPKDPKEKSNLLVSSGAFLEDYNHDDEALEVYKIAIDASPENDHAYYHVASLLDEQGKSDDAITYYKKVLEINPENWQASLELSMIYGQKSEREEALRLIENTLKYKQDPIIWTCKAILTGLNEKGLEIIEKAIELQPKNPFALSFKSDILLHLGKPNKALESAEIALKFDPKDSVAIVQKAKVLMVIGNYQQVITLFNDADPKLLDDVDTSYILGFCYVKTGAHEKASTLLNRALVNQPDNARIQYLISCNQILSGDKSQALKSLKRAIKLDPSLKQDAKNDEEFFEVVNDSEFKKIVK